MELTIRGQRTFVFTAGRPVDPTLPTLVLLHGAASDHSVWAQQSRYLADRGRNVLAVDLPGHGRSDGAPLPRIEDLADWLPDLLDAAGIDRASLAGHSMGSLVALEAAARMPQRITGIALLGTAVPMAVSETLLAMLRERPDAARRLINQWSHAPASLFGGNQQPGIWMAGASLALMRRSTGETMQTDFSACNAYRNGLDAAARVRCPALLVVADRDLMTPARAVADLERALPDVRRVTLDACGHSMLTEQAERVRATLAAFAAATPG